MEQRADHIGRSLRIALAAAVSAAAATAAAQETSMTLGELTYTYAERVETAAGDLKGEVAGVATSAFTLDFKKGAQHHYLRYFNLLKHDKNPSAYFPEMIAALVAAGDPKLICGEFKNARTSASDRQRCWNCWPASTRASTLVNV